LRGPSRRGGGRGAETGPALFLRTRLRIDFNRLEARGVRASDGAGQQDEGAYSAGSICAGVFRLEGEFLKGEPKATGGDAQRTRFHKGSESPATLKERGITFKESVAAQAVAQAARLAILCRDALLCGVVAPYATPAWL